MKLLFATLLLALAAGPTPVSPGGNASTATLTVEIQGVKKQRGELALAIYDSAENFRVVPVRRERLETSGETASWVVDGLAYGDYAVAVYHDQNANGELDKNKFGIPKEPYAFSNDARGLTGPPKFRQARFTLGEPELSIVVRLK